MLRTPSLSLLPDPLQPVAVVPVTVPSMDRIELFNPLQYLNHLTGGSQPRAACPLSLPALRISVCRLQISCQRIIFSTSPRFPSGS